MIACRWGRGVVTASTIASQHDEGLGRSSLGSKSHVEILRSVHLAFSHPGPRKPFLLLWYLPTGLYISLKKGIYGTSWYPLHGNHHTRKTGVDGHIHFEAMANLPSDSRGTERELLFQRVPSGFLWCRTDGCHLVLVDLDREFWETSKFESKRGTPGL